MEFPFGDNPNHHHQRNDDQETPPFNQFAPQPPPPPYVQGPEFAEVSHVRHAAAGSLNYPPPPHPPVVQASYVHHAAGPLNYPPQERPHPPEVMHVADNQFAPPPPLPPYVQGLEFAEVGHVRHAAAGSPNNPPPRFDPPPPVVQVSHVNHAVISHNYPPQERPQPPEVMHVAHEVDQERVDYGDSRHSFRPHMPSFLHQDTHSPDLSELSRKSTVKVYCKANPGMSLTIRDNKVVLAPFDPSDGFQHWYKDEKYSTKVKDEEHFPCFALVNKVTGQAMKHSVGGTHPVQLVPYNPNVLDESVLWTEGRDLGDGYRAVRMVNNIQLNVDAFHGDKRSGGVHDGTIIVLQKWNKGDNQQWKIVPHCKFLNRREEKH